ncbi:MAG: hypothetical protein M1118_12945, partial [Chloroflexi bacterium]|nr:hypothetical protein [Chloroflexota bacterium]
GTAGLLGGLSLLPAGVGAVESALIASAVSFGGDPAMAVSVTLLSRVATLWMWMIPGFMLALRGLADSQGVLLDIPVDGRDGGLR